MKFKDLMDTIGEEPVFETGLLLVGSVDPVDLRRQLSRWTASHKLWQFRRGLYALAPPYQKVRPHPFLVANRMVQGSYVSCESALAHYGMIPEYVSAVMSVTSRRPNGWDTALGFFDFRHVKSTFLEGYQALEASPEQKVFIASPEKALLDLIYLHPRADDLSYLRGLRLQNLARVNLSLLEKLAQGSGRPKLKRAAAHIAMLACEEAEEYEEIL